MKALAAILVEHEKPLVLEEIQIQKQKQNMSILLNQKYTIKVMSYMVYMRQNIIYAH